MELCLLMNDIICAFDSNAIYENVYDITNILRALAMGPNGDIQCLACVAISHYYKNNTELLHYITKEWESEYVSSRICKTIELIGRFCPNTNISSFD